MLVTSSFRLGHLDNTNFDYIVVGAWGGGLRPGREGPSDDASCSVLLIEAGRYFGGIDQYPPLLQRMDRYSFSLPPGQTYPSRPRDSMFTWRYPGRLYQFLEAQIVRGRVVGGSSAINGGELTRGRPSDYDTWAAQGNPHWSYKKVFRRFGRSNRSRLRRYRTSWRPRASAGAAGI